MRTLRLLLVGTVTVVLLAVTGIAAVAQSETEDAVTAAPVVVSGTLECLDSEVEGEDGAAPGQSVVTVYAWQADDERLSGEASYAGRWALYGEPNEETGNVDAAADEALYEIVNEGGAWACETVRGPEPRTGETGHTLVFSGEGGYEGMTAYLHVDWSQEPYHFSGLILQGDEPPYAPPQG